MVPFRERGRKRPQDKAEDIRVVLKMLKLRCVGHHRRDGQLSFRCTGMKFYRKKWSTDQGKTMNVNNVTREVSSKMIKRGWEGFPGGAVVGSLPANAGDTGSSPGLGGSHMPRSN